MAEIGDIMLSEKKHENKTPKRKGRVKRAILWTLLSLVLLVIVAIAAAIIWLGPIVEWYIEKHDTELIGRRVEIEDLRIRIFKGEVEAKDVVLYEADDDTHFARLGDVSATIELCEILDNHIHISQLNASEAYLCIDHNVEEMNLDDMLTHIEETYTEEESDAESEPWKITLDNITIKESHFLYFDREIEQRWELTSLNIATPSFYLDNRFTHLDIATTINDSAALEGALELNYETWDFTFDGTLCEFPLGETYKYWTPYLNVGSVEGLISADLQLAGNVMDIFAMDISGEASAKALAITTSTGGKVLLAEELAVGIKELNIEDERYILDYLTANGFASEMLFNRDGTTNFDALFYDDPTITIESTTTAEGGDLYDVKERVTVTTNDEETPLANMTLHIGHVDLKGGDFSYADDTMHRTFEYQLRDISIKADNLDLMGRNNITVAAKLPKQGSVMLRWDGSLSDFHNQSLMLMLNNVDMIGLSPFVEYYTGFPVKSGNLTFRSQNIVTNGSLSGINQFGTYNLKLGKRDKSLNPDIKLPLRLAVWVLTDSNKHIDIDLPVEGDIDSPKFSYGKIIMKTVGSLMLKIAISPFQLMAGEKQDAFQHIDIDILEAGLTSEHYARLDKMAEALKEDNSLRVRLTQRVNYKSAAQRIANLNLKVAYYNHAHGAEEGYLDMLAFSRINDLKLKSRDVIAYADSLLTARGIDPSKLTAAAKAMTLYGDMVKEQLPKLMEFRNRIISDYMSFQHQDLAEGAFSISNVVLEEIMEYRGKDRYTVTLIIDDEEVELTPAESEEAEGETREPSAEFDDEGAQESQIEETPGTNIAAEDNLSASEALEVSTDIE